MKTSSDPVNTALVPGAAASPLDPATAGARVLALFLSGRSPHTLRAYRCDVQNFTHFVGLSTKTAIIVRSGVGSAGNTRTCFGVLVFGALRTPAWARRSMGRRWDRSAQPPVAAEPPVPATRTGLVVGSRQFSCSAVRCRQAVNRALASALLEARAGSACPQRLPQGKVRGHD
jgi:hypothetical protein